MVSRTRKAFRLQLLPLIAGFAVLAAIVGTRSLLIESQQADNDRGARALRAGAPHREPLSLVQDAETGQRGFLLTGEDALLGPYRIRRRSAARRTRQAAGRPWRTIPTRRRNSAS